MRSLASSSPRAPEHARQLCLDELGEPLREVTFVVFDLETTGGSAARDAITEIGAVKVRGGQVLGEFATLVDPGVAIPPGIVTLTGITQAMVTKAPPLSQVLPAFLEFAAGAVLVAHNSAFDLGFLRAACQRRGYPTPWGATLCTVRLARRALSRQEAPSCKLTALAALFGAGVTPSHRALDDARATVDVLHGLLERVGSQGVQSLQELLAYLPDVSPQQRRKRHLSDDLPEAPGVYLFRGPSDEVLYVGVASNLRRRVRGYFTSSDRRSRMREMVALAERVDSVACVHSLEAAVRELRLIAAHRPAYNRRSRNQRSGWWVTLTDEAFPRLSMVRTARPGAVGPIRSRAVAGDCAQVIAEVTGLRTCTQRIPARGGRASPCVLAELGRCGAPCAGRQDSSSYARSVALARDLIRGADSSSLQPLRAPLRTLAEAHRFEEAACKRDRLARAVTALHANQRLVALCRISELVAAAPDGSGGWQIAVLRHGRLAGAALAQRGTPPLPVIDAAVAAAETVLPADDPLCGAPAEEAGLLARWLEQPGVRLVRCSQSWAQPSGGAGSWAAWLRRADVSTDRVE
ncbi:MAG: DEDD exonuclease domain-containing protein [Sciscionella sp.]